MPISFFQRCFLILILASGYFPTAHAEDKINRDRPNILLAISDDQSFAHNSFTGDKATKTPGFDRIAREGVFFQNAFAASPGCSPCRAALLTGRHIWQIEQAGTHASSFPKKYVTFPEELEKAGYYIGYTGKGWGPGNWKIDRKQNPAGPSFDGKKIKAPKGISRKDYAGNFAEFLKSKPANKPFLFWYGAHEPHRAYQKGIGLEQGKSLDDAAVPGFLPDTKEIRSDILDYAVEIEWFDKHLVAMLDLLEKKKMLENTLVIVTSDNGMPFPRAKANCYEFGIHMPLAMRWGKKIPKGRTIENVVGFVDITATIYDLANVTPPNKYPLAGQSLKPILFSQDEGWLKEGPSLALSGRERHSSSRVDNLTYPQRSLRTKQYLYIWNPKSDRWPAGDPQKYVKDKKLGPPHGGYHDIDACPSLTFLIQNRADKKIRPYFLWAVQKRLEHEFFDIQRDPSCLKNLADDPAVKEQFKAHQEQLKGILEKTKDPRVLGKDDVYESYKRYSPIRSFPPAPKKLPE